MNKCKNVEMDANRICDLKITSGNSNYNNNLFSLPSNRVFDSREQDKNLQSLARLHTSLNGRSWRWRVFGAQCSAVLKIMFRKIKVEN